MTLELHIRRTYKKEGYTVGDLSVNGIWFSNTIEDCDRGLRQNMSEREIARAKIYGETAIPSGTYKVEMTVSPKFRNKVWAAPYGGRTPELKDVPGYSGVRIHPGNTAADSLGCILPGMNTAKGAVTRSQATYRALLDRYIVPAVGRGDEIYLTIE